MRWPLIVGVLGAIVTPSHQTATKWVQSPAPVLVPTQQWEGIGVQEPTVIRTASGGWRMWYTAGWAACAIGYASSSDGTHWTKYQNNPVIGHGAGGAEGNACHASITVYKGTVYAFFVDDSKSPASMYLATSRDGIHFDTAPNPVLAPQRWAMSLANSFVWVENGQWKMLFEAQTAGPNFWAMGYTSGRDPHHWRPVSQPLQGLAVSPIGMFGGPTVVRSPPGYVLYYHASPSSTIPTDIYQSKSRDLQHWSKPVEAITRTYGWETDQVADASVVNRRMYFTGVYHVDYGDDRAREDIGVATATPP